MRPVPKHKPYRNPKILAHANGQACTRCGAQNGTTVAAHSNSMAHGKGVGLKSDDCFTSYLCATCHSAYDTGLMSQEEFDRCMAKTWKIIIEDGILR